MIKKVKNLAIGEEVIALGYFSIKLQQFLNRMWDSVPITQEEKDSYSSGGTPVVQAITYSATPTMDYSLGKNGSITLTGNVTTLTLTNVTDGGGGNIIVKQNAVGGYGINAIAHAGLTIQYLAGTNLSSANINAEANGYTHVIYYRSGNVLFVSFGNYNSI